LIVLSHDVIWDGLSIKNFVQAYQSDEVETEAKNQFKDGVVKGW